MSIDESTWGVLAAQVVAEAETSGRGDDASIMLLRAAVEIIARQEEAIRLQDLVIADLQRDASH